jgi:hypothetical protein
MKNKIFLTEEGKQEIEARIAKLEEIEDFLLSSYSEAVLDTLKEILESATVLPIEKSWNDVDLLYIGVKENSYPNGVIIKS